jgi:hypothetical protein
MSTQKNLNKQTAKMESLVYEHRATLRFTVAAILAMCLVLTAVPLTQAAQPLTGAIFTTNSTCTGVNLNLYDSKKDVYLDGGPPRSGAAGLPDGKYFVKVTEPNGTLLGTSLGSGNDTPVLVKDGEFDQCYQLSAILIQASDGTPGYDTTSNPGGEYKVWVSNESSFPNNSAKTDNFKVDGEQPPETSELDVIKFYDANANGLNDDGQLIAGWKVSIQDTGNTQDYIRTTPVSILLAPGDYTVTEFTPVESNWMSTTNNPVMITLVAGQSGMVEFGNLCLGQGGGHTKGFWSKSKAPCGPEDLALMDSLNLRNKDGSDFDPQTCESFKIWLKRANAVNMAYMLSAQLAAMELNVSHGFVDGSALIYAPGTNSANSLGFATVHAVMNEANTELGKNGYTPAGNENRNYQERLKDVLDNANNNQTFVQPTPCAFSFAQ